MPRKAILTLCLASAIGAIAPAGASAASPWTPYRAADFSLPAGSRCSFALSGHVLVDRERIRTTQSNPDGTPRRQQVVGRLVVRYRNDDSGASVKRNLTGDAFIDHGGDGSTTLTLIRGHFAVGLAAGDSGGPAFLVFTGHGHALTVAADGRRTLRLGSGRVENLCDTLG